MKTNASIAAVLGGCGFIGSALVRRLIDLDLEQIYVVDNLSAGHSDLLPVDQRVTLVRQNVNEVRLKDLGYPDKVFYLCGSPYVPTSFIDPDETMYENVEVLRQFLRGNVDSLPSAFIYASSGEVYGNVADSCADERQDIRKRDPSTESPYGQSRVAAEQVLREDLHSRDLVTVALRLFNVIGPRATHAYFVPEMIRQVSSNNEIAHGNLETIRDFVWIGDTVEAFILAMKLRAPGLIPINVATGTGWRMIDILSQIVEQFGLRELHLRCADERVRPVELERLVGCNSKALRLLGWRPNTSLSDSLAATIRWYREIGSWPYEHRANDSSSA